MKMSSLKMVLVFVGLLVMAEQSMQLSLNNLQASGSSSDSKIIKQESKTYGLLAISLIAEKALNDSGIFIPSHSINLFGRTFVSGTIHGLNVVYVRSQDTPSVYVGMTVQILCEKFEIDGIIHYNSAGSTNDKLNIGDVVVPSKYFFNGAWEWLNKESGDLKIGDYNLPTSGSNMLGSLLYKNFEYYVDDHWQSFASLAGIQIDGANVTFALRASSSDIYVSNAAYRNFLSKERNLDTADTTGAAFLMGALSNSKKNIVFLGIAYEAGAGSTQGYTLAYKNVVSAVSQFFMYLSTLSIDDDHHVI